jgi:hypothetical protein
VVLLGNSGFILWLLVTSLLYAFVIERTLVTWVSMGGGIALSTWWFARVMRRAGITVRFGTSAALEAGVAGGSTA